ncbi:ABC transporter substrate-binding protein, partial [Pseudomonas viridiflava]
MSVMLQAPETLRVGVSALFDPDDTPHARTFLRALAVARNVIPELGRVQWHLLDDGANARRGAEVAQQMIDWRADLVIGHFSSDAAIGAAPLYQRAGMALLT